LHGVDLLVGKFGGVPANMYYKEANEQIMKDLADGRIVVTLD